MKKLFAILLAVTMLASMATVVSAAENTTTLTTTVPAATYTLNIPANQEIAFGATETDIGSITVTDGSGFAVGKNLEVTLDYSAFISEGVTTTIPFSIKMQNKEYAAGPGVPGSDSYKNVAAGDAITFLGKNNGTVTEYVTVTVDAPNGDFTHALDQTMLKVLSSDWGKALAGEYTATITFTAEVVVE